MNFKARLAELEKGLSEEFKAKIARWEAEGVFDQMAAKVEESLEEISESTANTTHGQTEVAETS